MKFEPQKEAEQSEYEKGPLHESVPVSGKSSKGEPCFPDAKLARMRDIYYAGDVLSRSLAGGLMAASRMRDANLRQHEAHEAPRRRRTSSATCPRDCRDACGIIVGAVIESARS